MAKIDYAFPVDKIHGKISKSHKVGFAHRKASKLNYTTSYGERTTPVTDKETAHRTKFGEVVRATMARMADPNKIHADQTAFRAQTKYTTFYSYVFNLEWEAYSAE